MNKTLIQKWNCYVHKTDTVYHLGDIGVGYLNDITTMLNGNKILIRGNHDTGRLFDYIDFEIIDYPIILEDFWMLSHKPLYINENMPYVNIFGHVHNNPIYKDYSKNHYCVSAERIHYAPISFDKIKWLISLK